MALEKTVAPKQVVEDFLEAFGSGDLPAAMDLVAEDAVWEVQGAEGVPFVGEHRGKARIEEFFGLIAREQEARAFRVDRLVAQGDDVVVLGYFDFLVRRTGRAFDGNFAIHFVVGDGRISRYRMFENSHAIAAAYGLT